MPTLAEIIDRDPIATWIADFTREIAPLTNYDKMHVRIFCQDRNSVAVRFEIQLELSPRLKKAITNRSVHRANTIVRRAAEYHGRAMIDHGNVAFHFKGEGQLDSIEVTTRRKCG
jgi:hypothetical protein